MDAAGPAKRLSERQLSHLQALCERLDDELDGMEEGHPAAVAAACEAYGYDHLVPRWQTT
jgi:hypothetical protein